MEQKHAWTLSSTVAAIFVILLSSCGGGGGAGINSNTSPAKVTIAITSPNPLPTSVQSGHEVQFGVTVTGSANTAASWAVSPSSAGTITSTGLFTAATVSSNTQTTVTATAQADTTKTATATLIVMPATGTINAVGVSCSPSTIQVNQTSKCAATVSGTGSFDSSVTWSVDNGTIDASGNYTAPASATTATVKATSKQDPTKSGVASIVVQSSSQAVSISLSPSSATVPLGGSSQFAITTSGNPAPSVSCSVSGAGSVSVSGATATYSVPLAEPTSFSAALNCTATNSSGTASGTAQISLQYPVPSITSLTPSANDLGGAGIFTVQISGSGFYPGGILHLDPYGDSTLPQGVNPQQLLEGIGLSSDGAGQNAYSPGWVDFSLSSPTAGPGGGTSNVAHFALLEPFNSLVRYGNSATELMLATDTLYQYDLTTGSSTGNAGDEQLDINGYAQDDKAGNILVSTYANIGGNVAILDPSLNFLGFASTDLRSTVAGVAAGSGFGCVSVPGDGGVSIFPVTSPLAFPQSGTQEVSIPPGTKTGTSPGPVAMSTLNGQPACIVYDTSDLTLSTVQVTTVLGSPETQLLGTIQVPNLLTANQAHQQSTRPGWQLATFNSGPSQGASALLSDADNAVVFDDLSGGQEIRRVSLSGIPFDIVPDDALGVAIVANADPSAGVTRFQTIDPATGTVTTLPITTSFLATGMAVSSDGTKLFVANRDQFQTLSLPGPTQPTPSVTLAPSSPSVNAGGTQQFTANVTGILDSKVTWSVNGVQGGSPMAGLITSGGLYIAPSIPPSPPTVAVEATSVENSGASGTSAVTITSGAAGSPVLSASPSQLNVALSSSASFTLTASGSGITGPTCSVTGPGTVQLSGGIATYSAPVQEPSSFTATVTCTATNSTGTGSATVLVALEYPLPSITTVTPVVVCPRECTPTFSITGSGFYPGGIVHVAPFGDVPVPADSSPNQVSVQLALEPYSYGNNFSPGWLDFSVSSPTDYPGGGLSNTESSAFVGGFNTAIPGFPGFPNPDFFQLDQSSGNVVGPSVNAFPFDPTTYDAAVDAENTGGYLSTEPSGVRIFEPGGGPTTPTGIDKPLALAEQGGFVCVSQDQDNKLTAIDLSQTGYPTTSVSYGGAPWAVAMTSLSSGEDDCVLLDAGDLALSIFKMPDLTVVRSVTLTGLTSLTQQASPPGGGWQLAVFHSGPAAGIAAVLSQADNVVVFVNLSTGQEIRRVSVNNPAIRIAPDDADGSLVVATADTSSRLTRFQSIDVASGTVSNLQTTSDLLATGLGVSSDGTQLFVGMRLKYEVLPNQ